MKARWWLPNRREIRMMSAAAERKRTVVEDDLGLANLDASPRVNVTCFSSTSVVKRAVADPSLENGIHLLAAHFGMHTRPKRIRNA